MKKILYKDIPNYEGLYQATTAGEIYRPDRIWITHQGGVQKRKAKFLSKNKSRLGYLLINLCKDGISKKMLVHRLIAVTFIPNPENKPDVNHINGDKSDNRVENLEWCTRKENMVHASKIGAFKNRKPHNRIAVKDSVTGKIYDSLTDAAKENGVSRKGLAKMLQGIYRNNTNIVYA